MTKLRRSLGLPSLALFGLGTILGAGIYSVLGTAAGKAGDGIWLSFALSAVAAAFTALSYAELATAYPQAGAEYVYLRKALPRATSVAFAAGILMAASGAATAGTVALAFAGYFRAFVELPALLVSGGLVLVTTAVCLVGVRQSTVMTAVFTVIEATGLILVIVIGASSERFGDALANVTPGWNLFGGAALVFFSYLGFENIANLAEEAKEPGRTLPLAILVSLAASTVLYVLVALAAVALISPAELAASDAPLADAVRSSSPRIAGALGGIALFATANTALAAILSASRVLFGMARDGALPGRLASILPRRKTPWLATLVVAGSALALLPLGDVAIVASISSFAALAAFVAVNVALIVLRYSQPDIERPFRVPLSIRGFAVLPAFGAATAVLLITQLDGTAMLAGTGLLVVVLGLRAVTRRG